MNADGSNPQRRTYNTASDGSPAWSHDGTRIAFVRNVRGIVLLRSMPLMQMHARNVRVPHRQICPNQICADVDPTFSPDGTRIAFATYRDGNYEIYTMNPDGTGKTRVTTNTASDLEPSWQPTSVTLLPAISINDVTLTEPNSGTQELCLYSNKIR